MYDLIIIGSGPAGLTASIYASCFHLKHIIIGSVLGGQLQLAPDILNYPGFDHIAGKDLTNRMVEQVKLRGGELAMQSVTKINKLSPSTSLGTGNNPINTNNSINEVTPPSPFRVKLQGEPPLNLRGGEGELYGFEVETKEGSKYQTKAIILATGTERRKLNVPGEVEYTSRGVYYCATCEKFDYTGKVCAVIGGANSAVQAAVELAQAASKVYIIYRGSQLRGDPIWLEQVEKQSRIEVIYNTVVKEIVGDGEKVTGVKLQLTNNPINTNNPITQSTVQQISDKDTSDGGEAKTSTPPRWRNQEILPLDKVFIEIGGVPGTALVIPLGVAMDAGGYIKVDERLVTNVPGVFAAGDLVSYGLSIEQISSAVGLGARAASSAFAYIKEEKAPTLWGSSQIKR